MSKVNFLTYLTNKQLASFTSYFIESRYRFLVKMETCPNAEVDFKAFNWILTNLKTLQESPSLFNFLALRPKVNTLISYYNCDPKSIKLPFDVVATINESNICQVLDEKLGHYFQPDVSLGAQEFTAISIPILKHITQLNEDLYLKLISDRYLQLYHHKDIVIATDYEKYQKKGVLFFYIRRNSFVWIEKHQQNYTLEISAVPEATLAINPPIETIPDIQAAIISASNTPVEERFKNTKDYNLNGPLKLEAAFIQTIHENLEKAMTTIKNNKSLASFIKSIDLTNKDYIALKIEYMCSITCALAKALEWGNDATYEKLIYCSHVHDMKLFPHPEILRVQTLAELEKVQEITPTLMKIYQTHPEDIARVIREDDLAPQDAAMIVLQHHELPGDSGFPQRFQVNRILPFAAILNISSDLTDDMIRFGKRWNVNNYILTRSERYSEGIFAKVLKEVAKLLEETAQERVSL
ncbi:MAG: hypothetical protein HQK52_16305 [Oligoflexia bacterium]|nr:hypothetical protein [Oligoflexia bacterium]